MNKRKILFLSICAILFIMVPVVTFCVLAPQKPIVTTSSLSSEIMIDKNQPIVPPTSDAENKPADENNNIEDTSKLPENNESKDETQNKDETNKDNNNSKPNDNLTNKPNDETNNTQSPEDNDLKDPEIPENDEVSKPNDEIQKPTDSLKPQPSTPPINDNISSDANSNPIIGDLNFFINSKAITKTKQVSGNVTTFEIDFRVFVVNNCLNSKTILTNAFSAEYDIENVALYYQLLNNNNFSSYKLGAYESIDLSFTLKFIVYDNQNFDLNKTNNLVVTYMFEEIISLSI